MPFQPRTQGYVFRYVEYLYFDSLWRIRSCTLYWNYTRKHAVFTITEMCYYRVVPGVTNHWLWRHKQNREEQILHRNIRFGFGFFRTPFNVIQPCSKLLSTKNIDIWLHLCVDFLCQLSPRPSARVKPRAIGKLNFSQVFHTVVHRVLPLCS
jgi:hypothetical protein